MRLSGPNLAQENMAISKTRSDPGGNTFSGRWLRDHGPALFDIVATAGAKNKAVVEQFTQPASSTGDYVITFTSVINQALVSGIEIQ